MHKRAFERRSVNIPVRFYCEKDDYCGIVTNLSERGMFINIENISFPFDSEFNVILPLESEVLNVPVRVRRITKRADTYDGIGVEVIGPSEKYVEFVGNINNDL